MPPKTRICLGADLDFHIDQQTSADDTSMDFFCQTLQQTSKKFEMGQLKMFLQFLFLDRKDFHETEA